MEWLTKLCVLIGIYSHKIIVSLFIVLCAWTIAVVLCSIIKKLSQNFDNGKRQVANLLASTVKTTLVVIGVITALGTIGIDISALIASLGLTGFAIGFALKDAVSNLLSGILILFYQPFTYEDNISVIGCEGTVKEINLRYTVLQKGDTTMLIPNSSLFSNTVRLLPKA